MTELQKPWYESDTEDNGPVWRAVCARMRDLSVPAEALWPDRWHAFVEFVNDSVDPEVYGEFIAANPDALDLAWDAFAEGWMVSK